MIIITLDNPNRGKLDCHHEKQKFYYYILGFVYSVYYVRV